MYDPGLMDILVLSALVKSMVCLSAACFNVFIDDGVIKISDWDVQLICSVFFLFFSFIVFFCSSIECGPCCIVQDHLVTNS